MAMTFADASSQFVHTTVHPEEVVSTWEFTLEVSSHSASNVAVDRALLGIHRLITGCVTQPTVHDRSDNSAA
jgi:hypothetical protein